MRTSYGDQRHAMNELGSPITSLLFFCWKGLKTKQPWFPSLLEFVTTLHRSWGPSSAALVKANPSQEVLVLCAINKLWGAFLINAMDFKVFLLELGPPSSHNIEKWLGFWTDTRPSDIHYVEVLTRGHGRKVPSTCNVVCKNWLLGFCATACFEWCIYAKM